MTLYHFGNCLAISTIPYYLTYKYTGLSEYGAFWKCIQTIIIYALTQLCKMLVLATFFQPIQEGLEVDGILRHTSFGVEFLKVSVDLIDFVGIYFALARIPGRGHSKILAAAIGWGAAELIFTRFLVLWVGAKGVEFNWRFIQMSLESNIALVQHISTTALVWLWQRHDVKRTYVPFVCILLVCSMYKYLVIESIFIRVDGDAWLQLLIKAITTFAIALGTLRIYVTVA